MSKKVKVNYRKIWEEHNNQKIPPGYHIHHIDGDRTNNDPSNLVCVDPEEHHKIHLDRGDIVAKNGRFIQGAAAAGRLGGPKGSGWHHSEENKQRIRIRMIEHYKKIGGSPQKGIPLSEDHKKNISNGLMGENNPMFGKNHSEETRKKMSNTILEKKNNEGENNPMFGKKHSEETRKILSECGKTRTGEKNPMFGRSITREKNLRWYNDGITAIYVPEGSQPHGFQKGRKIKNDI